GETERREIKTQRAFGGVEGFLCRGRLLVKILPHADGLGALAGAGDVGEVWHWKVGLRPDRYATRGSDADYRVGPSEAAAEGDEDQDVSLVDFPGAPGLVQRDGDRRRRGVAVLVDVHVRLAGRHAELLHRAVDDPLVHLVRDDELHVVFGQLARAHRLLDQLFEFTDGKPVELAPA